MPLPEYVKTCEVCKGRGEYEQYYTAGCGGGSYKSTGPCDYCKGQRFVYKNSGASVGDSVLAQIENANQGISITVG